MVLESKKALALVCALAGASALVGCSAAGNGGNHGATDGAGGGLDLTTSVSAGSGGGASSSTGMTSMCTYPTGAVGISQGKLANGALHWQGFPAGSTDPADVKLSDYYDCDGTLGVGALLVDVSATWCEACQEEAIDLHARAKSMAQKGVRVLTLMIEDASSSPATINTARQWKTQYKLDDIATVADPKASLLPQSGSIGLPYQVLIDPRTMKIVSTQEGYSGDYSDVLALAAKNQ